MAYYVYSTLSQDTRYCFYDERLDKHQLPSIRHSVTIRGGANVSNKHFITPRGVCTKISDEDYELLKKDYHFQQHLKNGFVGVEKYVTDKAKESANKFAKKNLKEADQSAPLTPKKCEELGFKLAA